jgi:hypothetical protein
VLLRRIRNFYFPPPEASIGKRMFRLGLLGMIPIVILLLIPPAWEYSNSVQFCGETCHTMPPEYQTYQVSPHARVLCVDCHIGRGLIIQQAYRKTGHMRLLWDTLTNNYEYPIRVRTMRPARETCELCHYPEKFSDDSLRVIHRFEDSEENTPYDVYLLMHTGGGTAREGLGRGIHWHIENKVEYVATDKEEQDIPWVRVTDNDGTVTEYTSIDVEDFNPDDYSVHVMDCITCHNRISHLLEHPRNLVDDALNQGDLSLDIPNIRAEAIEMLDNVDYESSEEAGEAFADKLTTYYSENYPDFYATNADQVDGAVRLLEELWGENNYPEQELHWQTHPNNVGHRDSAGCFRCHDGKHFSEVGEAVRLECNLCHSVPQIVRPGEIEPTLPLTTGIEPASHLETTWISQHHLVLDSSCANCHTMDNAGGTGDTSFCSNSGCHGIDWEYAGFNAPALAAMLGIEQQPPAAEPLLEDIGEEAITYQVLQPVFEQTCGMCHGATPSKGLRVTDYDSLMAGGEDGPVVLPGFPDDSLIVQVLTRGHFAQLTEQQMTLLRRWIESGAPEGEAAAPEATEEAPPAATEEPPSEATEEAAPAEAPAEGVTPYWETLGEQATPAPAAEEATATPPPTPEVTEAPPAATEEAAPEAPAEGVTPYWETLREQQ